MCNIPSEKKNFKRNTLRQSILFLQFHETSFSVRRDYKLFLMVLISFKFNASVIVTGRVSKPQPAKENKGEVKSGAIWVSGM